MTKLTISLDYDLSELRLAMTKYMGAEEKAYKKSDIAHWLGSLVQADVMDILSKQNNNDED